MKTQILTLLTPIIAPLIVALVKTITTKLPKWSLPLIAGIAGGLVEVINSFATGAPLTGYQGIALGLAGVGVREFVDQLGKARAAMLIAFVAFSLWGLGCATMLTDQTVTEPDGTIRNTKVKARTFMDAKSKLADFKASNSEKTQSIGLGSLDQESSATNANALIGNIVERAVKGAVEGAK